MAKHVPHNTDSEVREYIAGALLIVEELAVPDDLRQAVFAHACSMLSAKQIFWTQADAIPDVVQATILPSNEHH